MRSRLLDTESGMLQYRRLLFFHATYIAPKRTAMQASGEFVETGRQTYRVHFDAAVVQITGITGKSELRGCALGEVAITHALHASAHPPAAGV